MKYSFFFLLFIGALLLLSPTVLLACKNGCNPAADCPNRAKHLMESGATTGAEGTALDPVCGMEISKSLAVAEVEYQGKTYYFCMEGEKASFLKAPGKYLKEQAPPEDGNAQ